MRLKWRNIQVLLYLTRFNFSVSTSMADYCVMLTVSISKISEFLKFFKNFHKFIHVIKFVKVR